MSPAEPDDPKAKDPVLYVVFGVLALPLLALAIGSFVLLPALAASLFLKGVERNLLGYKLGAAAPAIIWLLYLRWVIGRLARGRPRAETDGPPSA